MPTLTPKISGKYHRQANISRKGEESSSTFGRKVESMWCTLGLSIRTTTTLFSTVLQTAKPVIIPMFYTDLKKEITTQTESRSKNQQGILDEYDRDSNGSGIGPFLFLSRSIRKQVVILLELQQKINRGGFQYSLES